MKAVAYQRRKFATCYKAADVELLAYVDKAHGNLRGPATRHNLDREYRGYGQAAYQRLAAISVAHLYRLRNSAAYRKRNSYQPTRPTPVAIGERRKPQPHGSPGYLRIDTVYGEFPEPRLPNACWPTTRDHCPSRIVAPPAADSDFHFQTAFQAPQA